jgi:metal-responsive CopG/Arc/MetJ family transcriptional regulator
MARPKKPETMDIISIRLPEGLIEEIDRFTEKLKAETPLLAIGRADTVRYLLRIALRDAARKSKKPK